MGPFWFEFEPAPIPNVSLCPLYLCGLLFPKFKSTETGASKVTQSYETILLERRDRVAIATINRPEKRNALNIQTRAEGAAILDELRADDSVRVVILTGAGDKAFIAGADIAEFADRSAINQREVMLERSLFNAIDTFPKPIIAMVNGYCLGGGCEVALACDLRIASEKASFGQPEINLGIIPGGGGTQRLTRLVGEGKAMELILTGEIIDAQTAFAIGLVNHVVPADQLETRTMEIANRIAEKSPIALRLAKEAIRLASRSNLDEGLRREVDLFALCFSSEDKDEGVKAFLEKRKPVFKGK
jgi:enoyl-CoA hydratase